MNRRRTRKLIGSSMHRRAQWPESPRYAISVPKTLKRSSDYWYSSGDEHLDFLGIDRVLLGTMEDTRQRFLRAIRNGDPEQQSIAFAIIVNGDFAGCTLLNRYTPEVNYSHWASGISTALYPYRVKMYFDVAPMIRLIHQTRTRNVGVNRMLDKYVPVAETLYFERPEGIALSGDFHIRYVRREDVPKFFEKTVEGR
jgi:hypothetical protein